MGVEKVQVPLHRTVIPTSLAIHLWFPGIRLEWIPEGALKLSFGWNAQGVPKQKTAGR